MKILAADSTKPDILKKYLETVHTECVGKSRFSIEN